MHVRTRSLPWWAVTVLVLAFVTAGCGAASGSGNPGVVVVGDSLLAQSRGRLQGELERDGWTTTIDGRSGSTIQGYPRDFDWPARVHDLVTVARPDVVVVELGTNGCDCANPDAAVDRVMRAIGDVDLVMWVTVRDHPSHPERAGEMNSAILANSLRWPNLRLVDLGSEFRGHSDWLTGDGVHFTDAGQIAFARLVTAAIRGAL